MEPLTFIRADNPNAEEDFRAWQWQNQDGYYINRKSPRCGMLHRVSCMHVGPPGTDDPRYRVTVSPKHCHASSRALREWARAEGIELEDCSTCGPR